MVGAHAALQSPSQPPNSQASHKVIEEQMRHFDRSPLTFEPYFLLVKHSTRTDGKSLHSQNNNTGQVANAILASRYFPQQGRTYLVRLSLFLPTNSVMPLQLQTPG